MERQLVNKILILTSSLGLLLFFFLTSSVKPTISDDSPTYINCAQALAHGSPFDCDPSRTPGYPLFLLLTDTLFGGLAFQLSVVVQYLLVLATGFLLYRMSLLMFSDTRVGLLAFILAVTYPLFLFYSNNLLTEIPFMFLLTAGVYSALRYSGTKNLSWLIFAGASFALAALTRPYALFFLPILLIYLLCVSWKKWKTLIRDAILVGGLFAMILLPWVWKNTKLYGRPALHYLSGIALATNIFRVDGLPLVDSALYAAEKTEIKDQDPHLLNPYRVLEDMGRNPAEIDGVLIEISLESISQHPAGYIAATAANFAKLAFYPKYAYGDYLVIDQARNLRQGRLSEILFYIYRDLQHKLNYPLLLLTGLGIAGAWLGFKKTDQPGGGAVLFISAVTFFSLLIPAATIIPNVRYRVVTDQFFMLFAGYALIRLWDGRHRLLKSKSQFSGK